MKTTQQARQAFEQSGTSIASWADARGFSRPLVYAVLGVGWVLPLLPLVRWMERISVGQPPLIPGSGPDHDVIRRGPNRNRR